jgi:predicted enzyme related to lactoylglutathione lyase
MVQFGAFHISTERPKELGEFYKKILGVEPAWENDWGVSFQIGAGELLILKHDQVHGKNSSPQRLFFDLIVDDVAAEFQRIVGLGAVAVQEPYPFDEVGIKMVIATLADLDGNYFQLLSRASA